MTKLSVNINKVATLRNARGGNMPDVQRFAVDCELFGAQGITVHPRPDERHIRKEDVYQLKSMVTTELNVEGNPTEEFLALVEDIRPTQVTLVPDDPNQLTSNHGWDTRTHLAKLTTLVRKFKAAGIRVSIFVDPDPEMVEYAHKAGADRVELYTGPYAELYPADPQKAIELYRPAAEKARELGLGLNAGHDLNLHNLTDFVRAFPWTAEVSIGQAVIADMLYFGMKETISRYRACLGK
jgi:pyridoxine 5-phosphate synthase